MMAAGAHNQQASAGSRPQTTMTMKESEAGEAPLPPRIKIDVNQATPEDLLEIPGMDGDLAHAICEGRDAIPGGVRFRNLDDLKNCPFSGGIVGKKKVKKWEDWIAIEPWACAGSVRVGVWNLEGLSDDSAVDKHPNFEPDSFLNTFVTMIVSRFDLIVLEELDTFNCNRLRERFMRHEKVGQGWRWMEAAPSVILGREMRGVPKGVAYVWREKASEKHPAVELVCAPNPDPSPKNLAYPANNVALFKAGGFVFATVVVHLSHCKPAERSELIARLVEVNDKIRQTWRTRANILMMGDFGTNNKLDPGVFSAIQGKYRAQEPAPKEYSVLLTPSMPTLKVTQQGRDGVTSTCNVLVPHALGPWWWPSNRPATQPLGTQPIDAEAGTWALMAQGAHAEEGAPEDAPPAEEPPAEQPAEAHPAGTEQNAGPMSDMELLEANRTRPSRPVTRSGRHPEAQMRHANAERRFVGIEVIESDVPKRFLRVMGRAAKDFHAVMCEFNTSSGADTPNLRQLDYLAGLTGFSAAIDDPMKPGAPVPGDPSASSPRNR